MKQNKQDRRSQRTRRLVVAALMELMQEKRYETITVRDLLTRANIGKSTFYTHFFDKADVLALLMEELLAMWNQALAQRDAGRQLIPSLEVFQHVQAQSQYIQGMLQGHEGNLVWDMVHTTLSSNLEQALTTSHVDLCPPAVPLPVLAQYVAGSFLTLLRWWLTAEMPYPPEQMERIFLQLTLPGVWATIERPS